MKQPTKKEIINFIEAIVPKNWRIIRDIEDLKRGIEIPLRLNIKLFHLDISNEDDPLRIAEIHGGHQCWGKYTGMTELWLYPITDRHKEERLTWKGSIIHELAHVAVDRWLAWKMKVHKNRGIVNSAVDLDEPMHESSTFQNALYTILMRAIRILGDKLEEEVINDVNENLEFYGSGMDEM